MAARPKNCMKNVGNDGADNAEEILRFVAGCVAEARIVRGPGRQAGGDRRSQRQNGQAGQNAEIAFDQSAKGTHRRQAEGGQIWSNA